MPNFYAVKSGRKPGIYKTWDECKEQTVRFKNAQFKKFSSFVEAEEFIFGTKKNNTTNPGNKNASPKLVVTKSVSTTSTRFKPYETKRQKFPHHSTKSKGEDGHLLLMTPSTSNSNSSSLPSSSFDEERSGRFDAVVYTDGCCISNGRRNAYAGIGVYWGPLNPNNVSEPVLGRQTNNSAEIEACCRAITQAKNMGLESLEIRTDSKFLIDCITKWVDGWKENGWMTKSQEPVKNRYELERLDECRQNIRIKWTHVAGHAGIVENEEADRLAKEGALKHRSGF